MSQEREGGAPTEKKRKIAIATTVACVLLLVFLLIVLIIQFVQIGVRNDRKRDLDRRIEAQQETLADARTELEYLEDENGLFWTWLENYYNKN